MRSLINFIIMLGVIFVCSFVIFAIFNWDDSPSIYEFRVYAERHLKDPSTAQFREERMRQSKTDPAAYYMCAEINAKNDFGGYTGFRRSIVYTGALIVDDGSSTFDGLWRMACSAI